MRSIAVASVIAVLAHGPAIRSQTPAPGGLRIIVLAGEDAVNIVQQKTAVRPLVEVRDRNDLPVAGVTVTFTIGRGQPAAFAGGVQTLTVTTNGAGQAEAAGFNVLGAGSVQIRVQAAYQGLIASAAISQTNFATAAAASRAGAGAGGGGASGTTGAAAGGGGGLSATTIGIVGAAVGGGALVATRAAGGDDGSGSGNRNSFDVYRGTFSGPFVFTSVCTGGPISPSTCAFTRSMSGTMTIDLSSDLTGGRAFVEGSQTDQSVTGTQGCSLLTSPVTFTTPDTIATGGPSALTATSTRGEPSQRTTVTFSGAHSGSAITGSLAIEVTTQTTATTPAGTSSCNGRGTSTVPVTLQRVSGTP